MIIEQVQTRFLSFVNRCLNIIHSEHDNRHISQTLNVDTFEDRQYDKFGVNFIRALIKGFSQDPEVFGTIHHLFPL